ncbi:MAG: hypothetical protein QG671_4525 [Actinomycetota bacterium]|jgi:hypothetical protein|nr:hypothetical protein [Actinomycetota bacterium]
MLSSGLVALAMLGLVACGGGASSETSQSVAANVPPAVAGLSAERVQSELDGLSCGETRDIVGDVDDGQYFTVMAQFAAGSVGGTEAEWRGVLDWWWQTACGGK